MKLILYDEVLRQKLIQKGVEQVSKFSWKLAAEKVLQIYGLVTASRRRVVAAV
jgi:hypothetical protein